LPKKDSGFHAVQLCTELSRHFDPFFVGPPARLVCVADLAAIAQHQRIPVKIRHSEVIQITRGIVELVVPPVMLDL
jgi:hypothetical protein